MDNRESGLDSQHNLQKYKSVIGDCKDLVLVLLTMQLGEMASQIQPTLMDFSEKAETNDKQRFFYDAISQAESNWNQVEYRFREELTNGFSEFSRGNTVYYIAQPGLDNLDLELSIVENQELEEQIASDRIIAKAYNRWYQELYGLGKRMGLVRGGLELPIDEIPGGPAHIIYAFQQASKLYQFDITILLILYALFDKFVIQELDNLYQSYNDRLVEAGIFPNLKLNVVKRSDTFQGSAINPEDAGQDFDPLTHPIPMESDAMPGSLGAPQGMRQGLPPGTTTQGGSASIAIGEEIFQSICSILGERRRSDPSFQGHPEVNPRITGVIMTERPQLVAAIGSLQPESGSAYMPWDGDQEIEPDDIEIDTDLLEDIRLTLSAERDKLYADVDRNTIPMADLDTIELVGMVFEHVLNDDDLPNIVKALISHLHTPYLKIAIIDTSFLIDGEHSARLLLNLMVDAGKRWVDEDNLKIGIYYPMKDVVDEILVDFHDDLGMIERLHEKLNHQIEDFSQKSKIVEDRSKEAARGRDKLESARSRVYQLINQKIGDSVLHKAVTRFLQSAWLDKMILMLLRSPEIEKSPEWQESIAVIEQVVWVCDKRNQSEVQARHDELIPELKETIESGLSTLGDYHQPDCLALFQLFDSLKQEKHDEVPEPVIEQSIPGESRFGALPEESPKQQALNSTEQKIEQKLQDIEFGTWFQLMDHDRVKRQVKLSWFSPVTRNYMFVDKSGVQAIVISSDDLVKQISERTAKVINNTGIPFVDSALSKIKSMLNRTFGTPPTGLESEIT